MCPDQPWPDIRNFGNMLRHGYDLIDGHRVWHTVANDLPPLKAACQTPSPACRPTGPERRERSGRPERLERQRCRPSDPEHPTFGQWAERQYGCINDSAAGRCGSRHQQFAGRSTRKPSQTPRAAVQWQAKERRVKGAR